MAWSVVFFSIVRSKAISIIRPCQLLHRKIQYHLNFRHLLDKRAQMSVQILQICCGFGSVRVQLCKCGDAYCVALSHISAKFLNRQQFSIVSVESASEYSVNVRRQLANTIYVHNIGCELWHEMPANFRYLRFCLMHMYIACVYTLYMVHCILYTHTNTLGMLELRKANS